MDSTDDSWWEPIIPAINAPESPEGQKRLQTLPPDVQAYLRLLGRLSMDNRDGTTGDADQSDMSYMCSGMAFLLRCKEDDKAFASCSLTQSWVDTRLEGLKVLEEQAWQAWEGLCGTGYEPPDYPEIMRADGIGIYITNLRTPLPWNSSQALLNTIDRQTMDALALAQYRYVNNPGIRRGGGTFDFTTIRSVDGKLPPLPSTPSLDTIRRSRPPLDVFGVSNAGRHPLAVLRINSLDEPVRLLVNRQRQPPAAATPCRDLSWLREILKEYKARAKKASQPPGRYSQ